MGHNLMPHQHGSVGMPAQVRAADNDLATLWSVIYAADLGPNHLSGFHLSDDIDFQPFAPCAYISLEPKQVITYVGHIDGFDGLVDQDALRTIPSRGPPVA
jgi:hypothetical protein